MQKLLPSELPYLKIDYTIKKYLYYEDEDTQILEHTVDIPLTY